MNREHLNFPPPQQQIRYIPSNQPSQQIYSDYGMPINLSDVKKSNESLKIFNGQLVQRQIYPSYQRPLSQQQGIAIAKSTSQKNLPIIYNAYNERVQQYQNVQNGLSPKQHITTIHREGLHHGAKAQIQQFQENHSDVYQYNQDYSGKEDYQNTDVNGIHTFKCLPSESNPQTAQFIQLPSEHVESDHRNKTYEINIGSSQMERQQAKQYINLPQERFFVSQNAGKSQSRVLIQGQIPFAPPSPRMKFQPFRQSPPTGDQSAKLVQIPQEQYQNLFDQLQRSKQNQQQIIRLKARNDQLDQKEHFYWEENMTLREQNKRLRDLVTHLEKREKQLLKEKEQFKQECNSLVNRYRQSLLEQFGLLFERYKLQVQKNK